MTDAEAYVAMYEENLLREGDSPYVRGQILSRALRSGTYPSQEALGTAFNISLSAVSRLLMVAQLPSIIVAAFPASHEIREAWGVELFKLWRDEGNRARLVSRARALANKGSHAPPRATYEMLTSASDARRERTRPYRNIPVRGASDLVLFHEQEQLSRVMYIIPKAFLNSRCRDVLKRSLVSILEEHAISHQKLSQPMKPSATHGSIINSDV
jgi:hypothetical protein